MGLGLFDMNNQTLLNDEEREGLRILTISTHADLDEFEQQNIEDAMQWLITQNLNSNNLFTEKFIKKLHKKMYGDVWDWAGEFRKTNKNLGIDKWQIPVALKLLLDDTFYWVEKKIYPPDEIAIRFKHRLVSIHCFPNGNGRHSRLMADVIINKIYGKSMFFWGTESLTKKSNTRRNYLKAVKAADLGNLKPLLSFARS